MKQIILIFFIMVQPISYAIEQHDRIPLSFQGKWAMNRSYCEASNPGNIIIYEKKLKFWESEASVIAIVTRKTDELALISEFTGEGENWLGFSYFRLSDDKNQIIDLSDPYAKKPFFRNRCSKNNSLNQ